jgi:hypothetical protein
MKCKHCGWAIFKLRPGSVPRPSPECDLGYAHRDATSDAKPWPQATSDCALTNAAGPDWHYGAMCDCRASE